MSPTYEIGGFYHWALIRLYGFCQAFWSRFCSSVYSYSARPIVHISLLFCNYTTSSCHRLETCCSFGTYARSTRPSTCSMYTQEPPVDLIPTTLVVLRLIVHKNIAVIRYYYTTGGHSRVRRGGLGACRRYRYVTVYSDCSPSGLISFIDSASCMLDFI